MDEKKFYENLNFLEKSSFNSKIDFNIEFPYNSNFKQIILSDGLEATLIDTFKILKPILTENHKSFAIKCSQIFFSMVPFWNCLLSQHKYIDAILFWHKIEEITFNWEKSEQWKNNEKKLHKGSLYGFIAKTYLCIGDLEKGFTYFSNALEADYLLKGIVDGYPDKAPSNLTLSLSDDEHNFMRNFTNSIRSVLNGYLKLGYGLEELENLLLKNDQLREIKLSFVYSAWSVYEYRKLDNTSKNNLFNSQRNLQCFFNFCLIIESILFHYWNRKKKHSKKKDLYLKGLIDEFSDHKPWRKDYLQLEEDYKTFITIEALDQILKNDSIKIEAKNLYIAHRLRNYGGHSLQPLELFVSKFDEIIKILLFDILYILDFYNKK